jgi:alpha-amylase
MVKTCGLSNVKIIVDAVINHMTGGGSGTGIAGTQFSKYNYPEHPPSAFHYCAGNGQAKNIADYNNVKE